MAPTFDLFPQSREPFSAELFQNPTTEYRGTPLWSWNNKLTEERLMKQIDDLADMGFGGFHMHVRVGLEDEYLGPHYMNMVTRCVDRAKEKGMLAWLYDEDRWPSGYAGGGITLENEEFRSKHLLLTPWAYGEKSGSHLQKMHGCSAKAARSELGTLVARYRVVLDDDGLLQEARRLSSEDRSDEDTWYAYVETNPPSAWFNNSYYIDALNKTAMKKFMDVTYETYKKAVGSHFGTTIPAMFTDEPQFAMKTQLQRAHGKQDIFLAWTSDLGDTYKVEYGEDLLDKLPELVWDSKHPSKARYNYHDHVCNRFVTALIDQLGDWCVANGIALTGHMMQEPTLSTQTGSLGEAMRCYRNMQLPGIDLLCDRKEYNTAKQCQSASRQFDRCGCLSEIYGVTNWTFDFEGHKGCGDWQAALGINVRCHHLAWLSMAGEAKRDYPAAIGYQSPWYKEYPLIEDYFSRVHTALSRGRASVRVGVIHPVESFWLGFGPRETSADELERDNQFESLTDYLSLGLIDFDFISESLLPEQNPRIDNKRLCVGSQAYEAIVVPNLRTIRSSTLRWLADFEAAGGEVVFWGARPTLVDATAITEPISAQGTLIQLGKNSLLRSLEQYRDVKAVLDSGERADSLLYQFRLDGVDGYVFFCNTDRSRGRETDIQIRGSWVLTVLDAMTGSQSHLKSRFLNGWTHFHHTFDGCGSLLLRLSPRSTVVELPEFRTIEWKIHSELRDCKVSLSEPNVLLLDIARHRLDDDSQWHHAEEVLRIDNIARNRLDFRLKQDAFAQPYATPRLPAKHTIHLQFDFESTISLHGCSLALENAEATQIFVNGEVVPTQISGWWVDEDIKTVSLPDIAAGKHTLGLAIPFSEYTNIERVYILGSFGVELHGRDTRIVPLNIDNIRIGDYTRQMLPFYAGNVNYDFTLKVPQNSSGNVGIRVPRFKAPLLTVDLDGERAGAIAFKPYTLNLGHLPQGSTHTIRITSYGNRDHAFGAVHLPDGVTNWYGPDAWRTNEELWSYEYTIREMGLLSAPRLLVEKGMAETNGWDEGSIGSWLS